MNAESGIRTVTGFKSEIAYRRALDIALQPGQIDHRVMPERRLPSLKYVEYEDFIFSQLIATRN